MQRHTVTKSPSPISEASEQAELMAELAVAPTGGVDVLEPTPIWVLWQHRLQSLLRLLLSRALLPDSIRDNPYTVPTLTAILLLLLLLPLRLYFFLVLVGLLVGYIYATPAGPPESSSSSQRASLLEAVLAPLQLSDRNDRTLHQSQHQLGPPSGLAISPEIDSKLDMLIESLIANLVSPWYVPLCKSGEAEFQSCVRSTINAAIMNFIKFGSTRSKDTVTLVIYGITNALIVHMEEFRGLEASKMSLERFISSGRSRRTHHRSYGEELEHLRQIAALLLRKLLPRQESRSILLNSLLKEIIASNALAPLIDRISDPDFINEMIIKHMQPPSEARPTVESGWNLVILKVLRGKNLPACGPSGGLYLIVHIAGRRVKTKKIREPNQLWNEILRFKISNLVKNHLKIYVQLLQFNSYLGQDISLGFSRLIPDFDTQSHSKPTWLRFASTRNTNDPQQPANRTAMAPEILIEVITVVSAPTPKAHGTDMEEVSASAATTAITATTSPSCPPSPSPPSHPHHLHPYREAESTSPPAYTETLSTASSLPRPASESLDHGVITLENALQNNELFMEFLEYLNDVKAPPYLQFLMNIDALRQFAAMSIGVDNKTPAAIDDYFKRGPLSDHQREQLKAIKHDSADIFASHFVENARYWVPLDPGLQKQLQEWLALSDRLDERRLYVGGPIGPNLFIPAYRWVMSVLEEVYFPKFKESDTFRRFLDRARFAMLNFTVEDDRMSIYSTESMAAPSGVSYGGGGAGGEYANERTISNGATMGITDYPQQRPTFTDSLAHASSMEHLDRLDGGHMREEQEVEMKKIATAIAISRQKVALIDEQLERLKTTMERPRQVQGITSSEEEGSTGEEDYKIRELAEERKNLSTQIDSLLSLLQERAAAEEQQEGGSRELWLDLQNVNVRLWIAEPTNTNEENEGGVLSSLWSSTMGSVMTAVSEPVFVIEVSHKEEEEEEEERDRQNEGDKMDREREREGGEEGREENFNVASTTDRRQTLLPIVSRRYSDFYQLHRLLTRQFPKIGKIEFPEQPLLNSDGLQKNLQAYLEMLLSDEFVRQSSVLREFLTVEGKFEPQSSAAGQFIEAVIGKKVKDALQSATSIITGSQSGGIAMEEQRSRFYEARKRHTTSDVRTHSPRMPSSTSFLAGGMALPTIAQPPVSHSVADFAPLRTRTTTASNHIEATPRRSLKNHHQHLQQELTEIPLEKAPSVELPPIIIRPSTSTKALGEVILVEELSDAEIEMLIETFFAFVIETFELREPNQWLRRKLLNVFKQLLKQAYGDTLSKSLTEAINRAVSEPAILWYIQEAYNALYPDGIFIKNRPLPPIRSEDEKFATMVEARTVFLKRTPDFIQNMAGRYNAVCGMTRIFHALQHKELNKTLIFSCIDIFLKLFFSERPTAANS